MFTMNVANIMPGDRIAVELEYSEMLVPEEAVYEFVYPTVVGPRYGGGADPARDRWIANPYLQRRHARALPLRHQGARRDGHPAQGARLAVARGERRLRRARAGPTCASAAAGGGNRDFVLRYRLADDRIETGVLLWEGPGAGGGREKFFAMMLEPPQRPAAAQIPPARVHLPAGRVGLDARLPARHRQGADAQAAGRPAPHRQLQRGAVRRAPRTPCSPERLAAGTARATSPRPSRSSRASRAAVAPS